MNVIKYTLSLALILLIGCKGDEKPSDAASLLSLKIQDISDIKLKKENNNFNIEVPYEYRKIIENTPKITFEISERANVMLDEQVQKIKCKNSH